MTDPEHIAHTSNGNIDARTLQLALESAGLAYWEQDFVRGTILRSPQWARMLGYDPTEIAARKDAWLELVHPDDLAEVQRSAEEHERGLRTTFRVEHRLRAADGSWRHVLNWGRVVERTPDGRARRALGFHLDLTERERTERELARLDKLESLGTLAGGIAHDFNNFLTAAAGNVDLARHELGDHPVADCLEQALQALRQARDLTRQLVAFTRGGLPPARVCDVAEAVGEAAGLALSGSRCRADLDLAEDLRCVEAAEGQLVQLFHNLLLNAVQAMPDGGTVRVRAANATLGADDHPVLAAGRYARIVVRDEGPGIPTEARERVFDPFFTTRAAGNGLGLATVFSICQHQGGHVELEPPTDRGAGFVVHLAATEATARKPEPGPRPGRRGRGRLLLMDDNDLVRCYAVRAAAQLGYTVTAVADGEAALDAFDASLQEGRPFAAVLLDLTVRDGLGGRETLVRLRVRDPRVKAVVASGYAQDPVMLEYRRHGFDAALVKPYGLDELARVLDEMLGGERRSAAGR